MMSMITPDERRIAQLMTELDALQKERDAALKELADTKAAIDWTMGKLKICDLFRPPGSIDIPAAAEGWLPFGSDFQDTARLDWINQHGRVGVGQHNQFVIVLDSAHSGDDTLPEVYNIRHILDLCRTTSAPRAAKRQNSEPYWSAVSSPSA